MSLHLKTVEAVSGFIADQQTTCMFTAPAGDVLVNLTFFQTAGCPVPTAGASYRIRLDGQAGSSTVDLAYAAAPSSSAGSVISIGYLSGAFAATTQRPLDHVWVTDNCGGGINVTSEADIGVTEPGAPLTAIEVMIDP